MNWLRPGLTLTRAECELEHTFQITGMFSWLLFIMTFYLWNFFSPFQLAYTTFLSYLSSLPPLVGLCLPLSGSSVHTVVAAVGPQLNRTAQAATGKRWIESKGEEAQTHTHHKAAECPAWPTPHPQMRSLVKEAEATGFHKLSAQPALHFPWASLPGSPWTIPGAGLKRGVMTEKATRGVKFGEKATEWNDRGSFISNSPPGPAPRTGRSWSWECF